MKLPLACLALLALPLFAAEPRYDQSGVPLEVDAPEPGLAKSLFSRAAQAARRWRTNISPAAP
jgi:hypothetical protein